MTPQERTQLLTEKRAELRATEARLYAEINDLLKNCEHQIEPRDPRDKALAARTIWKRIYWCTNPFDVERRKAEPELRWHVTAYDPETPVRADTLYARNLGKRIKGETEEPPYEQVWGWGGAVCKICDTSFGWYCPKSPTKYCDYKQPKGSFKEYDADNCRYCHYPEERK